MSDIDDIIREGKRTIGQTESVTRERLAQRYREAFDRIERELAYVTDLLADMDAGELVTAAGRWTRRGLDWRQQRLSGLLRLIDDEYDRLAALGVQDIAQGQRTLLVRGADDAYALAEASGITSGVGAALNTEAYAGLTAAMGQNSPVASVLASYGPFAAKVIERGIITGAMQGWGVDRILRDIRRQIPGGVPAWRLEAVIRTELMRAYRSGLSTAYQQLGVQRVRWVSALSSRTCAACLARHGTEYPADYVMDSHVNCRCVLTPVTGYAYNQPTGEEWLRRQPEAVQRRVLPTPAAYAAWSRGDVTLSDFVGVHRSRTWGSSVFVKPTRDVLGAR